MTTMTTVENRVTTSIETITPYKALEFLEQNRRNRPISRQAVRGIQRLMEEGLWKSLNGDSIKFDTRGFLIDGQHRLEALSNMPDSYSIEMIVVRGLDPQSQFTLDIGNRRRIGAQLSLRGVPMATAIASAARVYLSTTHYMSEDTTFRASSSHIEDWVLNNPNSWKHLVMHSKSLKEIASDLQIPLAKINGLALVLFEANETKAADFFRILENGSETLGHPVVALRKQFISARNNGRKLSEQYIIATGIMAYNDFVDGKHRKQFKVPVSGFSPENFPRPKDFLIEKKVSV